MSEESVRNSRLLDLLRKRDLNVDSLSQMIFSGRAHLTQVLRGQRNGTPTWNKLRRVLTAEELVCAMNFANAGLAKDKRMLVLTDQGEVVIQAREDGVATSGMKNPI